MSEQHKIQNKMVGAAKWSFLGECASKLIVPFTNMILARILEPEHFGVLSIVVMVTNFADLFTDAGFQKYLIQHYFKSDDDLYEYASVAFWTNMIITTVIWIIIFLLAKPLSLALNKPGYQWVIRIGSLKLFLTAITSVQRAIYQRAFDYKTLSWVRIIVSLIPIIITIPLALKGFLYWSLIIGMLASEFVYALFLSIKSKWRPRKYYSFEKLKKMFSFSVWSLVEQFTIWVSCYADTLVLSVFLTDYIVGLYKQPESIILSVFNVFSASIFGILFSALSRLNDEKDEKGFWNIVQKTQLISALIIFPISMGIYLYRDIATLIMLGNQWSDAVIVVGLTSISVGLHTVMNNTASEVYRAKGEPKVSVMAQTLNIVCLVPLSIISIRRGFESFVVARALSRVLFMFIHYSIIRLKYKIKVLKLIEEIKYPLFATCVMSIVVIAVKRLFIEYPIASLLGIPVGVAVYVVVVCKFRPIKDVVINLATKLPQKGVIGKFVKGITTFLVYDR